MTVTTTFSFTGAPQAFVVPLGITSIDFDVKGAAGGGFQSWTPYARGGRVQGTLPVTPGETLLLYVGEAGDYGAQVNGAIAAGGWNGGGDSGVFRVFGFPAGGGGGASDIRRGGSGLADRVVVAGGAGGNGDGGSHRGARGGALDGETIIYPGEGGVWSGAAAGHGGSQLAGGAGAATDNGAATAGVLGVGGTGATSSAPSGNDHNQPPGGGGGGGYYGGGGGAGTALGFSTTAWPGGGGSGYADPSATGVVMTLGGGVAAVPGTSAPPGHGEIVITHVDPPLQVVGAWAWGGLHEIPPPPLDPDTAIAAIHWDGVPGSGTIRFAMRYDPSSHSIGTIILHVPLDGGVTGTRTWTPGGSGCTLVEDVPGYISGSADYNWPANTEGARAPYVALVYEGFFATALYQDPIEFPAWPDPVTTVLSEQASGYPDYPDP